jgi:disulfide bond formation protein DsbB
MKCDLGSFVVALCALLGGAWPAQAAVEGDFNGDGFADLAIGVPGEDVGSAADAGAVNVLYGSASGLSSAGSEFWTQDSPGILDTAEAGDFFASALATGDFNGDGFADLAVGVSGQDVGAATDAGAITILYGSASGLISAGNQRWSQDSSGILDSAEAGDRFASTLATGDFNGDGFADLAVGVPYEDVGSITDAGAINILYGSAAGLTSSGNQRWSQDSSGIIDGAEANDLFGSALATGDFDGDGFADLAIGVPYEDRSSVSDVGAVSVIYGSASGLTSTGNQAWTQDSVGIEDTAEPSDLFGSALATGDFNGDGFADLAVGVPAENVGSVSDAGAVNILYGSPSRLVSGGNQFWNQDVSGIGGTAGAGDSFGTTLATRDFDGDGFADLVVGVPLKNVGSISDAGAINVIYGSASGLGVSGNQVWNQNSGGILGGCGAGDTFGWALATSDLNGDGFGDLAIGVPHENVGSVSDAGAVNVIYGAATGLASAGNQLWDQDSSGHDTAEANDNFGGSLGPR